MSNTKPVDSAIYAFSQLERAVSKLDSWFPTANDKEILVVYEPAVPTNTQKTTKFGLEVFKNTVLMYRYSRA